MRHTSMNTSPQSRLRAHMKLASNRLKLLQQMKAALAKHNRRGLSKVLEEGKIESAKIRIENIIQEDVYIELLEILEIYSELVLARLSTIHDGQIGDDRLNEAIHVLLYAAQYTDIKELQTMKPLVAILTSKEFVQNAAEDKSGIPPKVLSKIHIEIPSPELVDLYLLEIAKAYKVSVPGIYEVPEEEQTAPTEETKTAPTTTDTPPDDLWARFAALKK